MGCTNPKLSNKGLRNYAGLSQPCPATLVANGPTGEGVKRQESSSFRADQGGEQTCSQQLQGDELREGRISSKTTAQRPLPEGREGLLQRQPERKALPSHINSGLDWSPLFLFGLPHHRKGLDGAGPGGWAIPQDEAVAFTLPDPRWQSWDNCSRKCPGEGWP